MRTDRRRSLLLFPLLLLSRSSFAQMPAVAPGLPGIPDLVDGNQRPVVPAERVGQETTDRVLAGRAQYESNDERAVDTLRQASQSALVALNQVAGSNVLVSQAASLPGDVVTSGLAQKAAEAHYYWGLAADRFARRDEAITALTRSLRINRAISVPLDNGDSVKRDATMELGRVLREGLPLIAPDDALDSIAAIAHGGLWRPLRFQFDPAPLAGDVTGTPSPKFEFLVTDGKLFPPVGPNNTLSRVPPYYENVPDVSLPPVLHLNNMVAGYARETTGPNKGQWRQIVRVFYSSPYLTKGKRDDLPRAISLCEQFLKVQALMRDEIGVTNRYARGDKVEGVSTLWLLEVSALWPQDDDDPAILAQLGPLMPKPNAGPKRDIVDPDVTATDHPWMPIAGQAESAPGEIMFWKVGMARSEAEWVRELFHEYGHVSVPPLGGFRPPLEPFANGLMGETLGMIWAAQVPDRFGATSTDFASHVNAQAVPALRFFLKAGPGSSLRAGGSTDGLKYLQGLTVYLERVYGGHLLGKALVPLTRRAANVDNIAARRSLMSTQDLMGALDTTWANPWGVSKSIAIWLPGALDMPSGGANLVLRGDVVLKAGSSTPALLWVPPGADSLRIDGVGASNIRAVGLPFKASNGSVRIYFAGKTGWQTLSLTVGADAKISAAHFEKK